MGMFLSQYSMLKAIGYGESGYLKDETEKILEPFKLFVLVLHDPKKHVSFHQKFSELFARLDYFTGLNLLFMGIAKPSYDWYNKNQNRDYFDIFGEKENLIKSFHEIKTTEGSITAYSISKALNIDYDDLPCLVISPDFKNESFVALKTGESCIEKQLKELGYFASSIDEKADINSVPFKSLLSSIDYFKQNQFLKTYDNLATILADLFSFTISNNSDFGIDTKKHANNVFDKLKIRILNIENIPEIENVQMNLLFAFANKFKASENLLNYGDSKTRLFCLSEDEKSYKDSFKLKDPNKVELILDHLKINSEWLEDETNIIVSTTAAVFKMFMDQNEDQSLDFSPLVMGFSKIFEIESNLSVVHWIRKHLKIQLPEYYKKVKPNFNNALIFTDASIVTNPRAINFNMHKGSKWIPPGIGESEKIVHTLYINNFLIESFGKIDVENLLSVWAPIRESRNRAAHSDIMRSSDLDKLASNMNILVKTNNLDKILKLKMEYKGTN